MLQPDFQQVLKLRHLPWTRQRQGQSMQGTVFPSTVGKGVLAAAKIAVWRWDRALDNLERTQLQQLRKIIDPAKDTEFGKAHGFADIRTFRQYRERVPVGDYDSFSPYIERMRQGERNLIVPEFVKYFGNSSGSSTQGKSKFLPITERQIKEQKSSGTDALARYLVHHQVDNFTDGFVLGLFPPTTMRKEGPVYITCNPALMVNKLPLISRLAYLPDNQTMKIADYNEKLERIAELYLDYDVRMVSGTTCWFSLLFDKLLQVAAAKGKKAKTVREIWPNLKLLIGGGVAASPYLPVIRDRFGTDDFTLIDTYNATEGGFLATTHFSNTKGLLVIPHRGVFYEFIPVEQADSTNPERIPLWEVQPNKLYAIVVSTLSGLYSYKLGDIVRFTSTNPLCLEFAGRLSGCLSTTQELTTHLEIQQAFEEASQKHPSTAVDFAAGAQVGVSGSKAQYLLFAEFELGAAPADKERFIQDFDEALCKINRVYREHRAQNTAIVAPKLIALPPGSVARFMKESRGDNLQAKFPRIVDDAARDTLLSYANAS